LSRLARPLGTVEGLLSKSSVPILGLLAFMIALLKSGLHPNQPVVFPLESWPYPSAIYPYTQYGVRALALALQTESAATYFWISAILVICAGTTLILAIRKRVHGDAARLAILLVCSGPIAWVLFASFGNADPLLIIGGAILGGLGHSHRWALLGTLVALSGNPELTVVMCLSMVLVCLANPFRQRLWVSITCLGLASVVTVLLTAWSNVMSVETRAGLLSVNLKLSLSHFFVQFPLEFYSGLGLSLLVVIFAIRREPLTSGFCLLAGAILLPALMTAITSDQTRVFVEGSIAAVILVSLSYAGPILARIRRATAYPLTCTLGVVLFLPAVVLQGNLVLTPWQFWYPVVQSHLVEVLF